MVRMVVVLEARGPLSIFTELLVTATFVRPQVMIPVTSLVIVVTYIIVATI